VTIRRAAHTAWRRLGEELVVIDLDANLVYGLDQPGGQVWELLGEGRGLGEIAAAIASEATEGEPLQAVERFLAELAAAGLVEGVSEPAAAAPPADPASVSSPRILWRERVQRFGGSCGLRPGQGTPCGGKPLWS